MRVMKMKMVRALHSASFILAVSFPVLVFASLTTGENVAPKELASLLTEAEKAAIASVDGDPDFIVGVRGLAQPLCFRVEGQPGHVVRLLQDPESGVVVNARISKPVPDSHRTYLSAVLISRRNFRVVAKVGRVLVNRYRFAWGPVSVRRVHGHRVLIAPTLLALTLRNLNVTLIVKRHLPEGRRPSANDTDTDGSSSPNIASFTPDVTPRHHNGSNVVIAARATRRRVSRRRRPDEIDYGPRQRNRRHRRPLDQRRKKKKGRKEKRPSSVKSRSKRETRSEVRDLGDILGLKPELSESSTRRFSQVRYKTNVDHVVSRSKRLDNERSHFHGSVKYYGSRSSDLGLTDEDSSQSSTSRSKRSTPVAKSQNSRRKGLKPSRDASKSRPRGSRSRGESRRGRKRRPRIPPGDKSGKSSSGRSRKSSRRNSRRPSGDMERLPSSATPAKVMLRQADDTGRNVSTSGQGASSGSGDGGGSGDGISSGSGLMRDMAAYVGFYVADARDLSSQTHGLLGQFLHKAVTLQRVRQKANGVTKARLLVEKPRPHSVKATLRTRTNMALNSSSTCWWLREGGLGVVDGLYTDYLVSRFRDTEFLHLPPGLIGQ